MTHRTRQAPENSAAADCAPRVRRWRLGALLLVTAILCGCVYRIDVQQGNLLDEEALAQVEVGMTRSQVRFLLGTPVLEDPFAENRWDYVYHLRDGRHGTVTRAWHVVHFDDADRVVRVDRNVLLEPRRGGLFDFLD